MMGGRRRLSSGGCGQPGDAGRSPRAHRFPEETAVRAAAAAERFAEIQRRIREEQKEQRRQERPSVSLMPWGYGVASAAHVGG